VTERPQWKHLGLDEHIVTVGGLGLLPVAPGTWTSLVVAVIAFVAGSSTASLLAFALLAVLSFVAGFISIGSVQRRWGHDPQRIVIDELCGMALVFAVPLAATSPAWIIASFLLFRMYDIAKPWPISWINARTDVVSVLTDDVLAAVFTIATIYLFQFGLSIVFLMVLTS
jgi:phosphatidylglycerophosphatase A